MSVGKSSRTWTASLSCHSISAYLNGREGSAFVHFTFPLSQSYVSWKTGTP